MRPTLFTLIPLLALAASAPATPTGISIDGRTGQVYDTATGLLYLSTNTGTVQRYNPATNSLLPAWSVGADLNAIDVTPDHKYLFATEANLTGDQGTIYRVNLSTGAVSPFHYTATEGAPPFDIVALNDGRAIFSADNQYSAPPTPLRSIDYATGTISPLTINGNPQYAAPLSELWRNATHTTVAINGTTTSAGPFAVFSTATENYTINLETYTDLNYLRAAVSPDGTQVAAFGANFGSSARRTSDFSLISSLADGSGGFAFSPDGGTLYTASFNAGSILTYRTSDFQQTGTIPPGPGVDLYPYSMPSDALTASDDGHYLFLYSANGLNVYTVPEPASLSLLCLPALALSTRRRRRLH